MPIRLYVGNLPKENIERQALQDLFVDAGEIMSIKVIKDRKTGKCRGFAFVTVATDEMADDFIGKYNDQLFMDSPLKIEIANPRAKGKEDEESTPTTSSAPAPTPKPATAKKGSGSGGGGKKRGDRSQKAHQSSSNEGFQPDPRWADELTKLKEMLTAAANN
ncbi:RNA-binding protein [Crocosphaera sp. XPORK-15E]|uniref:RNA recognition motif domain-containing protein n=1 Tax=Crocosphaera sp. XPORK-15E TaxID=3110247 RepID=UPI002B206CB7|nr:RNA-binding protein [Crocosphaera sp. XPORK-15E]MEA5533677.1 RNA-binding protein [Crocosphaera sp. XPORK-15E]